MIVIGVYGYGDNGKTGTLIKDLIRSRCQDVCFYSKLEEWKKASKSNAYAIVQMFPGEVIPDDVRIDILVQVSEEQRGLQMAIHCIRPKGYIILNSDIMDKIDLKCRDIYAISYGLNGKATVTASSIDDVQGLSFNYFLQRSITVMEKGVVQPFETPISLIWKPEEIYSCLAAYTCVIVLGFEI
jgi:UDP-N-acetylmuramoyl-L-alanyl-D-glutamate--2,6-diaminopimelate ligase